MGSKSSLIAPLTNMTILPPPVASLNAGMLPTPSSARSTSTIATTASVNMPPSGLPHVGGLTAQNNEAMKHAQELSAKMGFRQDVEFPSLVKMFPGRMSPEITIQPKPAKAPVLRLDAFGREIDEQGNVVNVPDPLSTLNSFQLLKPELDIDPDKNPRFDPRMGTDKNKISRPKKMSFQFSRFGDLRANELRTKQPQLAKAKAEPDINPNLIVVSERIITKEKPKEPIPDVEWWDHPLLRPGAYGVVDGNLTDDMLKMERITIYPPAEPAPLPPQPLKLTKKEQKKMRTWHQPPKPKIKMSHLMRVLGSEATQDPTKLEKETRTAAAEREQAHNDRSMSRKLIPDELPEKKERKLFDNPNIAPETTVSVYRINDLSHPQNRFKVDVNAQEIGCVVIVEGGKKSIKRYGELMLRRIDWAAAIKKEEDDDDKPLNKFRSYAHRLDHPHFHRFFVHECRTEAAARKVFADAGVPQYWNYAVDFKDDEV
ncbi:unnamed protein product [Withania somnifera]